MKKGYEWIKMLSKDDQILFCKNLTNIGKHTISSYLLSEYDTFWNFIAAAFTWSDSSERHEYWSELANKNN